MIKKIVKTEVPISKDVVVGIPFGKSYYKPTPKVLRILGDAILFIGTVTGIIATISDHPAFGVITAACSAAFKYLSNCPSYKDAIATTKVHQQISKAA